MSVSGKRSVRPFTDRSNNGPSCIGSLARGGPIAPARPNRASGPFIVSGKQGAPSTRQSVGVCCSHRGIRDHAVLMSPNEGTCLKVFGRGGSGPTSRLGGMVCVVEPYSNELADAPNRTSQTRRTVHGWQGPWVELG